MTNDDVDEKEGVVDSVESAARLLLISDIRSK